MICLVHELHRPSSVERLTVPLGSWKMKWKSMFGIWPSWLRSLLTSYFWTVGLYS